MEKDFEKEVLERLTKIEVKLDDYNNFKQKCETSYNKSIQNEKDIEEIKENNKWLIRTIAGTIIGIVIEAIVLILK